jgi:prepilin-type N-terminal cleavage/methylation domain-containing protein
MTVHTSSQKGFTLIELSIVLVIIGLIVGGVLVGQDLIKAAETRAAIGQLEKYEVAANTFRTKYNGIPGDLTGATNFGFTVTGITTAVNGNGLLNRGTDNGTAYDDESAAFFKHLAEANMISEQIAATTFATASVGTIASYAPASKLGKGAMILAAGYSGTNYFIIGAPTVAAGVLTFTAGSEVPVLDSFSIDNKMDDGLPATGRVIAITNIATADAGAAAADNICVNTTPDPDAYNTGNTSRAADTECTLRMRTSF